MSARSVVAATAAVAVLAGCAQTVGGTPPPTFPSTPQTLAARIASGLKSLHTAHLTLHETVAGKTISASGDEQVSNGSTTALSLTETIPGFGSIRIVGADHKTYVELPAAHRTSGKPWALVRPGSGNPMVSAMADALSSTDQLAGLQGFSVFAHAIGDLQFLGTAAIDGATVGHYRLTVDVSRLPDSFAQKQALEEVGLGKLPIEMWVDAEGRGRKVTESLVVPGSRVSVVVTLGNFDAPVHISAPPASQVDTS